MKAWLVTWGWAGPHAAVEDKLAAILNPRLGPSRVGPIVELLHKLHTFSADDWAADAKRPSENAYPVQWDNGVCHCGDHPFSPEDK